jgi:hypothetical protein
MPYMAKAGRIIDPSFCFLFIIYDLLFIIYGISVISDLRKRGLLWSLREARPRRIY